MQPLMLTNACSCVGKQKVATRHTKASLAVWMMNKNRAGKRSWREELQQQLMNDIPQAFQASNG
jgi:hypothetical protein